MLLILQNQLHVQLLQSIIPRAVNVVPREVPPTFSIIPRESIREMDADARVILKFRAKMSRYVWVYFDHVNVADVFLSQTHPDKAAKTKSRFQNSASCMLNSLQVTPKFAVTVFHNSESTISTTIHSMKSVHAYMRKMRNVASYVGIHETRLPRKQVPGHFPSLN
jgi:hypothetical protein